MMRKLLALAAAGLLTTATAAMAQDNYGSNSAAGNNASNSNGAQNAQGNDTRSDNGDKAAKSSHKHKRQARNEKDNGVYTGGVNQNRQNSPNPSSQEPANPGQ